MAKKGDIFDGVLWAHGQALQNPYSEKLSGYPEDAREIIQVFLDLWKLPPEAVPNNPSGKSRWIQDARRIYSISPRYWKKAIEMSFKNYQKSPFTVSSIGAIINLLISTMAEINRELAEKERKFIAATQTKPVVVEEDEETKRLEAIEKLKQSRRKMIEERNNNEG